MLQNIEIKVLISNRLLLFLICSHWQAGVTDTDVIVGAILHDTVEDTETTLDEIEAEFGASVRRIVDQVSDDKNLAKEERKRLQIVHAPHKTPQVHILICYYWHQNHLPLHEGVKSIFKNIYWPLGLVLAKNYDVRVV